MVNQTRNSPSSGAIDAAGLTHLADRGEEIPCLIVFFFTSVSSKVSKATKAMRAMDSSIEFIFIFRYLKINLKLLAGMDPDSQQAVAMSGPNTALVVVSSILSFIGCIITFTTYICFKDLQTTSRHIIVCISISDFLTCFANIYGLFTTPAINKIDIQCVLQSFIGSSFVISSFLWTVALAVYLYITVVKENKNIADRFVWPWFHLVCWLTPLAINVVALSFKVLGNSGDTTSSGWCWINLKPDGKLSDKEAMMWMLIDGKGIEICSYFIVTVLYVIVKRKLRYTIRQDSRSDSYSPQFFSKKTVEAAKSADRKLIFVPVCFVLLRIWGTIRFFIVIHKGRSFQPTIVDEVLLHLQAVGDNLQGFVNCILFCFSTTKVRNHIKESCWKCCVIFVRCCYGKKITNDLHQPLLQ